MSKFNGENETLFCRYIIVKSQVERQFLLLKQIQLHQKKDSKIQDTSKIIKVFEIVFYYAVENKILLLQYQEELIFCQIWFAISLDNDKRHFQVREIHTLN
ncbi:unnamed protein product (macronuclear) [Paramecium tetraurelia]|uniref:Uncharacterized protein n=1 Tax=Paramecium tetraurelia TaxID=5888 RepID=A0CL41_PARTE|nr:uncharacterized protein GSPATT00008055001 [Paramecium tetraurelia]CAK71508.1 unnamed protein product [Paramecium tetraurelia]|eukprot:XP_001438905.1 hypothetical protein (macronuclear) [Paramecium tetraurelia strain d4-2]